MTPSKWLQRHRFKRQDAHWERADATLTQSEGNWTCHYRNVELLEGPHAGLRIPGAVGFGKTPWIAMARCHQEQAWRLAHPVLVRGSGRTTKMLRDCLEQVRGGLRDITLVSVHRQHAQALQDQLSQLAEREGVSLSEVTVRSVTMDAEKLRGAKTTIFEDHYTTETFLKRRVREELQEKTLFYLTGKGTEDA